MQQISTRPSFFEVYAAQHLSAALRPAVRFVLEVLSVRHPRLVRLANRSDEVFTAVLLLLEASHLYRHSALLAESFYALRRSSERSFVLGAPDKPLSTARTVVTLVLSVVLPHIRVKLDEWYADATGGAAASLFPEGFEFSRQEENSTQAPRVHPSVPSTRLRGLSRFPCPWLLNRILYYPRNALRVIKAIRSYLQTPEFRARALKWYPRICAAVDISNLLLNVLYLYGHSRFFSLSLVLQGLVLRRTTPDDLLQISAMRMRQYSPEEGLSPSRLLANILDRLLAILKVSFFASIFAFRFLQYFYAAEASTPRESGPVIPPPSVFEPTTGIDRESAQASGRCPLCQRVRTNPTACVRLAPSSNAFSAIVYQHLVSPNRDVLCSLDIKQVTSGYVFCYQCIVNYLQHTQKCPVTLAPTTVDDLVRVYDDYGVS